MLSIRGFILTIGVILTISGAALGQGCTPSVEVGTTLDPCLGLMIGQTFRTPETGWLESLSISVCSASSCRISIREVPEDNSPMHSGNVIYTSPTISASDPTSSCNPSVSSIDVYQTVSFPIPTNSIGLSQSKEYLIFFESGYGASTCETDAYTDGNAIGYYGNQPDLDLAWQMTLCPSVDLIFGCMDNSANACNYDASATSDDGSCIYEDCMGVCGGSAEIVATCGCVNGTSELTSEDCYGCTDPSACNYDSISTSTGWFYPPFDDGSCGIIDCHGDCGGSARETDCGCIGGGTGIDGLCVDGCLTASVGNANSQCPPINLKGQAFQVSSTGILKQIGVNACCYESASIRIRAMHPEYACTPSGYWDEGEILFTSNLLPPSCPFSDHCFSASGTIQYWSVPDLLLVAGATYFIEFTEGRGIASCEDESTFLTSFDIHGYQLPFDLGLELNLCTDPENIGCTDPEATNFSPLSAFDDGTCTYLDCEGTLNGTTVSMDGCGCVENDAGQALLACTEGSPNTLIEGVNATTCTALLSGQTWTAPHNGYLVGIQIIADSTDSFNLDIQLEDGPFQDSTIAALQHAAGSASPSCNPNNTDWLNFSFDSIPVQAGRRYHIASSLQNLVSGCNNTYAEGNGTINGNSVNPDAQFRVFIKPDQGAMLWGCIDQTKCNYAPYATHNSGECLDFDCLGQCPDSPNYIPASYVENCGCVGGPDSLKQIDPAQCFGCTDPTACNYDPDIITDDGSCNPRDCNGDCSDDDPTQTGFAILNPACGCVGGNVVDGDGNPVDPLTCSAKCQGQLTLSNFSSDNQWSTYLGNGAIQHISGVQEQFLTGIKLLQITPPNDIENTPFSIYVATGPTDNWSDATVVDTAICQSYSPIQFFGSYTSYLLYFAVDAILPITGDSHVFFQLHQGNWAAPITTYNTISNAEAYWNASSTSSLNDMYLQLYGCDDLYGCTDPTACNYDPWATANLEGLCEADCDDPDALNYNDQADGSCTNNQYCTFQLACGDPSACNYIAGALTSHPYTGEEVTCVYPDEANCKYCPSSSISPMEMTESDLDTQDSDEDGICDNNEIAGCQNSEACNYHSEATDAAACFFPNACGECSGETDGTGYLILSNDVDADGICDNLDNCINMDADNYDAPENHPCRGPCDTAPIFHEVYAVAPSSALTAVDGRFATNCSAGSLPGVNASEFDVARVKLTGLNQSPDYDFTDLSSPLLIRAGLYQVSVFNEEGCPGVSTTLLGSTFAQPTVERLLILPYEICCGNCGIHDADQDMICDDIDNCTDKTAVNFDSPDNEDCQYE